MTILETWCPPSREHWELLVFLWAFFPVFTLFQWLVTWYPMGKTSTESRFNVSGKIGWATMEAPGFITLLYLMYSLPKQEGIESLPTMNWVMAGCFTIHYIYRALLAPLLLNPSMSPIHVAVWASALGFQLINATCIGGWLAGYGPTTKREWAGQAPRIEVGLMIFAIGLLGNIYHDDELREIRRAAARNQKKKQEVENENSAGRDVSKVYMIPENGLFRVVLFPHYFCEWIEWCGFWMMGGMACVPARQFVINEVTTMLPRAVQGKKWYVERFGQVKVGDKKAVIPGLI